MESTFVTAEATEDSLAGLLFARIVDAPTDSKLGTESVRMREEGPLPAEEALTSVAEQWDLNTQLSRRALKKHGGADDGGRGKEVASFPGAHGRFCGGFIFIFIETLQIPPCPFACMRPN